MSLIRLDNIYLELGNKKLLQDASFNLEKQERVCLIGRNGAGKSSLIKIILGELQLDKGEISYAKNILIGQLSQSLPQASDISIFNFIKQGLHHQQHLIEQFNLLTQDKQTNRNLEKINDIEQQIEHAGGWNLDYLVQEIIDNMQLPINKTINQLSGGWRRRVDLAKAFVARPDILILDEPTNHLDLATIDWLESQLQQFAGSMIFVSHDRTFVNNLATRMLEIDRGKLISWNGNYADYIRLKQQANAAEDRANNLFDKRLAEEEAWIRKGIKARRTRNEGRVRALKAMRNEAAARVKRVAGISIAQQQATPSSKDVIVAHKVSYNLDHTPLLQQFSCKIRRGEKIALIGNNGVGKTTLIKLLLGKLVPDSGTVKIGANVEIGYFDQTEQIHAIHPDKSVMDNINDGSSHVTINGRDRHIVGYLKDFLFTPDASFTQAKDLSGGERNRLMLAKLLAKECNLLVLDEPTNDLDVEMLQALEKYLIDYNGTVLLVSHDRSFIDNIADSVLVFTDQGVKHHVGSYCDWLARGEFLSTMKTEDNCLHPVPAKSTNIARDASSQALENTTKYLSRAEQKELKTLLRSIEKIEQEILALNTQVSAEGFYQQAADVQQETLEVLAEKNRILEDKTNRWMELEES